MLKGIQKQMIMIKTSKSPIFEAAYLVVRADAEEEPEKLEMVAEANRIVEGICKSHSQRNKDKVKLKRKKLAMFLLGALVGTAFFALGVGLAAIMHS